MCVADQASVIYRIYSSYFHGLHLPAAVGENDRTRAAIEIKPNHNEYNSFCAVQDLFLRLRLGAKCKQMKIEHTGWSGKTKYIIDTTPRSGISNPFHGGGMDIFWNHTMTV